MFYWDRIKFSIKVFFVHLSVSLLIAGGAVLGVWKYWFVFPYDELLGGLHLFGLVIFVDVVCGPLLSAVVWNPEKSKKIILKDLSVIVLVQCAALAYGVYTLSLARPVALVYEVDRFVAVTVADVAQIGLTHAPVAYREIGLRHQPWLLGIRQPTNGDEALRSIELSMAGLEPSVRPDWWQSYDLSREQVRVRMKPLQQLNMSVAQKSKLQGTDFMHGKDFAVLSFLPLVSHGNLDGWIVVLDADANIVGFAAVGGF